MLRRALMKVDRRNKTQMQALIEKVLQMAMKGDMDAVRWISDRVDGKVAQSIQVQSEQTVHVVPWLPALSQAVQDQLALTEGTAVEVEALEIEDALEPDLVEEPEADDD